MKGRTTGTFDRPHSALNLRLALALFGLASCLGLAIVAACLAQWVWVVIAGAVALLTIADLVVIQRRRRARHRDHPGVSYSLFE